MLLNFPTFPDYLKEKLGMNRVNAYSKKERKNCLKEVKIVLLYQLWTANIKIQ